MHIGSVSNITPSTLEYSSSQRQSQSATSSAAASSASSAGTASSLSRDQSNPSSGGVDSVAVSYRTTVAGKNYGGTVEGSEGSYTASVPIPPPGASASGSTIQAAEDNLNMVLDTLA